MNFKNITGFNFSDTTYEYFSNFDETLENFQEETLYEKVYDTESGKKFSTTHEKNDNDEYIHRIISENVDSVEECKTLCSNNADCIGFSYQIKEDSPNKCFGLSNLGRDGGSSTNATNLEGWRKVIPTSISTSTDGNWRTETSWSSDENDLSDYNKINNDVIGLGVTVNLNNNITLHIGNKITNKGTIKIASGKTLSIYSEFENNGLIELLSNATLIINRDTLLTNNGSIEIHTGSNLILNGTLIDTNIDENSIINNGSINTTLVTSNNNIFYYYGETENNNLTGNVSNNITQKKSTKRSLLLPLCIMVMTR